MRDATPLADWPALLTACRAGTLAEALGRAPLPVAELLAASVPPAPGEPYGRQPLHRDDARGEVLLVSWREDTFCAPHDHGDASGVVALLRGTFVERAWRWRDGALDVAGERRHVAPTLLRVGAGGVHDMKATGRGLGVHFYVPAITAMRVFDRERRETLVVADDCGAWVPREASLVLSRARW
jgi:cysteine dioxygenase